MGMKYCKTRMAKFHFFYSAVSSSCTHTFRRRLKTHYFQQAPPSGSPKCLRFGLWLTLCTLKIDLLTYLITQNQVSDQVLSRIEVHWNLAILVRSAPCGSRTVLE